MAENQYVEEIKQNNQKTYEHKKENKLYIQFIKKHEVIINWAVFMDNYANKLFLLTYKLYKRIIIECVHTL